MQRRKGEALEGSNGDIKTGAPQADNSVVGHNPETREKGMYNLTIALQRFDEINIREC